MEIKTKQQILERRKEIEKELLEMLKKTQSNFRLDDIKKVIYNEESHNDLTKMITMFDQGQDLAEINEILEVINDAWNYFPHRCLDGLCPTEKILEYY